MNNFPPFKFKSNAAICLFAGLYCALLVACGGNTDSAQKNSLSKGKSLEGVVAAADDPEMLALKKEVESLKAQVAPYLNTIDDELLRTSLIRKELLGNANHGCWASEKIERLDMNVVGSILEEKLMWESPEKAQRSGPSPWAMTYVFGDGIRVLNPDERRVSSFSIEGQLTLKTGFTGELIGEIDRVEIVKGGSDIRNEPFDYCSGLLRVKCREWNRAFEVGRVRLDGLSLKANGDALIYENNNIGVILEGKSLSWKDFQIDKNPAYRKLMSRKDCPNSK